MSFDFERDVMAKIAQITKSEKRALKLLVIFAMGLAVIYGAWLTYQYVTAIQSQQVIKEFKQNNEKHTHGSMHTALMLDSTKHSTATPDGLSFGVDYDWSGVMQITVDKYEVFDSPKDAGLAVGEYDELSSEYKTYGFALITFRLKNIDAKPLYSEDEMFNIGTFHYNLSSGIAYFNISAYPSHPQYYYHYKLDPGEEKTVVLGFYLDSNPVDESPELTIGVGGTDMYYHISLEAEKDDKQ